MSLLKSRGLSFKLLLLFLLTAIIMVVAIRLSSGNVFANHFQNMLRPHVYQYFNYINEEIGTPPNLQVAKQLSEALKIKIILQGPDLHWSSDGIFLNDTDLHQIKHRHAVGKFESGRYRRNFYISLANDSYQTTFITKNNVDSPPIEKLLFSILSVLTMLYLLLRWMISPLKSIQQSVKRIGSGDLEHRIPVKRQDELGELSTEINAMADDVKNMLEAKRQLLLAISHELRSPITRAKVAMSLMDEGHLKKGMESDLNEMEAMISCLLEAEKLNHRHQVLNLVNANINELIVDVINKYYSEENMKLELDKTILEQALDEPRIQFTIKNLINNALKHRKGMNDEITLTTQREDKLWLLIIEDHGEGIPRQHLQHVTDPFYRVDPSRQRETGGYGLGLHIIKMIVEAHQGELIIESVEGVGTKVIIKFPYRVNND